SCRHVLVWLCFAKHNTALLAEESLSITSFRPYDDVSMDRKPSIMAIPPQPGLFKQCLHCCRLFALREARVETDSRVGEVRVSTCTACGREQKFVKSLPPHVV